MPKINQQDVVNRSGTSYPEPFDQECASRQSLGLSDAGGLTQFGVHQVTLPPGCWASQRHWHSAEDEFSYILTGTPTLVDQTGRTKLQPGDSCCHKAGEANGHHLVNETKADVVFLIVGSRIPEIDHCTYPDIDLDLPPNGKQMRVFKRKD